MPCAAHVVALPDLGLPQCVEALDRVLYPVLERRREHGDDAELQTQAGDAADGVRMLMRSLKHRVVVELSVAGQSVALPPL